MLLLKFIFLIVSLSMLVYAQDSLSIIWNLNRTDSIGGYKTTALTEYPSLTSSTQGEALLFDGINDAIFIENNPIGNTSSFSIEVMLKPDSSANPLNVEQRYIHIRGKENDNRRVLLELRLTNDQKWFFDTYIRSEFNGLTLIDSSLTHQTGKWYHIALVYDKGIMHHYVNGVEEASGEVTYVPIGDGQISIGARQNPRSWFKGEISLIKFTRRALPPNDFLFTKTGIQGKTNLVQDYFLCQNYPNPFNPSTNIKYMIEKTGFVTINIYNLFGEKVTTLCSEEKQPEIYTTVWNGKDDNGNDVSSGVYFYKIQTPVFSQTKKMMLMR